LTMALVQSVLTIQLANQAVLFGGRFK